MTIDTIRRGLSCKFSGCSAWITFSKPYHLGRRKSDSGGVHCHHHQSPLFSFKLFSAFRPTDRGPQSKVASIDRGEWECETGWSEKVGPFRVLAEFLSAVALVPVKGPPLLEYSKILLLLPMSQIELLLQCLYHDDKLEWTQSSKKWHSLILGAKFCQELAQEGWLVECLRNCHNSRWLYKVEKRIWPSEWK